MKTLFILTLFYLSLLLAKTTQYSLDLLCCVIGGSVCFSMALLELDFYKEDKPLDKDLTLLGNNYQTRRNIINLYCSKTYYYAMLCGTVITMIFFLLITDALSKVFYMIIIASGMFIIAFGIKSLKTINRQQSYRRYFLWSNLLFFCCFTLKLFKGLFNIGTVSFNYFELNFSLLSWTIILFWSVSCMKFVSKKH